jgi:hypothetical protein
MIQASNYLSCVCGTVCTNMMHPEQIQDFWDAHEECYGQQQA